MNKIVLITACLLLSIASMAQKVKHKDGLITVDGEEYLKVNTERIGSGVMHTFLNLEGDAVLEMKSDSYLDDSKVTDANKTGKVNYFEMYFPGSDTYGEMDALMAPKKKIPSILFNRQLVSSDGILNQEKAKSYIQRLGTPHTKRRKELNPEVIIERETILIKEKETVIVHEKSTETGKGKRPININVGINATKIINEKK